MNEKSGRSSRWLRWLKRGLAALGLFIAGVLALLLVALDLKPTREFVRARVNAALADAFVGQLHLERLGSLRLDEIGGIDARVQDAQGRRVLAVRGLQLRSNWPEMVRDLVLGRPLAIELSPLTVDHIEVRLIADADGSPTLASAFNPREPTPPSPTTESSSVSVRIDGLRVKHLWAHGSLPSLAVIDAELSELKGSFSSNDHGLLARVDGVRLRARSLPAKVDPSGSLKARIDLPSAKNAPLVLVAEFEGQLAAAPATLRAEMKGQALEATLLAPAIPASVWRELLPSSKLQGSTAFEARVHGQLPRLEFNAKLLNEAADVRVQGRATLEETTGISCELDVSQLDLGTILGDAPATRLALTARANVGITADGVIRGDYRVLVAAGRVAANDTPALATEGKVLREEGGLLTVDGRLDVEERGAPTRADYALRMPADGKATLAVDFSSRLSDPPRLAALGLRAKGSVDGRAELDLSAQTLSARASALLSPIQVADTRVRSMKLDLTASGALASPELALQARAADVAALGRRFQDVSVSAVGTPDRLYVTAEANADKNRRLLVQGRLTTSPTLTLDQPSVKFSDREGDIELRARRVRVDGGQVQVEELALSGLGELRATGSFSAQRVDARFALKELDLARLSRLAGLAREQRGTVSLEGKVQGPPNALQGRIRGRGRGLTFDDLTGGEFELDLALEARKINGSLDGKLGRSRLRASLADVDLPSAPFTLKRLQNVRGELAVEGLLQLTELSPVLRSAGIPLERAGGQLTLNIRASNPRDAAQQPSLNARVKSQGLRLVGQRPAEDEVMTPAEAREAEPLALEGIDFTLELDLDPKAQQARVKGSLFDRAGPMLTLEGESRLPRLDAPDLRAQLDDLPLKLALRVPPRAVQKLPSAVRPNVMRGELSFELDAEGTLRDPNLQAQLSVLRLQAREGKNSMDLKVSTRFSNAGGTVDGDARATRGGTASLRTRWKGNLLARAQQAQSSAASALDLDTDLILDGFPVGIVPAMSERQVRGPLSGEVRLRGLGRDASVEARFDGSGMTVNRIKMPGLKAEVRADNRELLASVDVQQSPGSARAELRLPSAWGERWAPIIEPRGKLRVQASAFQLEALSPLVMQYLSALEGSLDADLSAELEQGRPALSGTASLTKGVVQIPQLGQRFSDIRANVKIQGDEIRVDGIQARGITGRVTADARAKLDGAALRSASLQLQIKEDEKLPVTLEGVMIGEAYGQVAVSYAHLSDDAPTEIEVDVPAMRLIMPEGAQNSVQDLAAADDVRIGAHRADGRFVVVPLQPLPSSDGDGPPSLTRVSVKLGDSVWLERGRQVLVQLTGDLQVESAAETQVRGRIELRGGKLDVSGKQFEIERGVVTFAGGDPANPTITATARWDSPAEYTVYADYSGTVENGKLKLRSEPPLSQDEVLSLILFGTPSGSMGGEGEGEGTSGAGAAVSVAGGTATKGLNRALSDVTSLDVSTRIDTSTGSARPELVVQLTPRLTTRVTRAMGEPAPGQSPDRTFLTLELRLRSSWAISAIVGDHGASTLDLIWRKRY